MMVSYNVPASGGQTSDELVPLQTVSDVPVTQSTPTLPTPTGRTTYPTAPITPPAETAPLEDGDEPDDDTGGEDNNTGDDEEQTGDDVTGGEDDGDAGDDEAGDDATGGEDDATGGEDDGDAGDDEANGDEPVEGGDVEGGEATEIPTETPTEEPTEEPTEDTGGEDPQIVEVSDDAAPIAPAPDEGDETPPAPSGDTAVWDELAECESSGDWAIDTGNGYHGGLQFDEGTWDDYGGNEYAPDAHQATKDQQIEVAERVRDDRGGYGSWPACSQQQGLPQ